MPNCEQVCEEFTAHKFHFSDPSNHLLLEATFSVNAVWFRLVACIAAIVFCVGSHVYGLMYLRFELVDWVLNSTNWSILLLAVIELIWFFLQTLRAFNCSHAITRMFLWFFVVIGHNAVVTMAILYWAHKMNELNGETISREVNHEMFHWVIHSVPLLLVLWDHVTTQIPVRMAHTIYCFLFILFDAMTTVLNTSQGVSNNNRTYLNVNLDEISSCLVHYFIMATVTVLVQCILYLIWVIKVNLFMYNEDEPLHQDNAAQE